MGQRGEGSDCLWNQTLSLCWFLEGRLLREGEDGDSEDSSTDTGGLQTQEWNAHKDRASDDHQDNQDDDPAVLTRGLGRDSFICKITITIPVFVITYPNLTKMKRHVWYWCSRVPVSFPNQVLEKSTPLTTLCDTDRSALISIIPSAMLNKVNQVKK